MYLLYCDETNLNPTENEFFIYGGIALHDNAAKRLHDAIENIRQEMGIAPEFLLKFNPKPDNLTHQEFITVKQRIMEAAAAEGCVLLISIILHLIATSPDDARRNEINRVAYHFNCLLNRRNAEGLVLIDRFSDSQIDAHLREKFAIGIRGLPYTDPMRLNHILGYHYSAIGQSHFGSVVDIILGSLRFAVNAYASQDASKLPAATRILKLLSPLFLRYEHTPRVDEISLFFSPKVIRSPYYRQRYASLKEFLNTCGIDAAQDITGDRTY